MIRILIADDHRLVRQCFRALLERDPQLEIVGEAGTGPQVIELANRLRPDIVLLDILMPGVDGLEAAACIHQQEPDTRIIIVTMTTEEGVIRQALENGAKGFLCKPDSFIELGRAIHAVYDGDGYLSTSIAAQHPMAFSEQPLYTS